VWTRTVFHAPERSPPAESGPASRRSGNPLRKTFFFLPLDKNGKSEYDEKGFISAGEKNE
jgi:hypothetical protein